MRLPRAVVMASAVAVAGCLAGCTVIQVLNGETSSRVLPGLAVVTISPGADHLAVVRSSTFGLSVSTHQTTLGYSQATTFISRDPTACHVFAVVRTAADAERLRIVLEAANRGRDLCIVQPEEQP